MPFALKLVAGPTVEPVSLDEAKAHLLVNVSDADADITAKIVAARADAENECGRAFLTQTWKLVLDWFPMPWLAGANANYAGVTGTCWGMTARNSIKLPIPPCQSVSWVKYYDTNGVQQTLSPSAYYAAVTGEPARVVPVSGNSWPGTDLTRPESVEVQYVTGYGDAATALPADLKAAILLILGDRWRNRGDEAKTGAIPEASRRILTNYRAADCQAGNSDV